MTKEEIKFAITNTNSMSAAAAYMKIHFNTFKRLALKYDLYKPNQGLSGVKKPKKEGKGKIPLQDILEGKHPQYQSYKLKHRLYESNLKKNVCEICKISSWNNKKLNCELDHIDGDRTNNSLSNLRILCPNCHSQTETYRFKCRNLGS